MWLVAGAILLSLMSLGSPWIIVRETIEAGQHVTIAGPLFMLFAAHVILYPAGMAGYTIVGLRHSNRRVRGQLSVIGLGIIVTAAFSIVTGILLPYAFHQF